MTHFLTRLDDPLPDVADETPAAIIAYWPAIVLGAILLPWLLYPVVNDVSKAIEPAALWDGLWPVALGVGLALAQRRLDRRMPYVPAGDVIEVYEAAFRRLLALGPVFEKLDTHLRQWPAASVSAHP